ncbi:MAG: hypothetical protein ACO1TE_13440 [Prosthecobacter sp.]
MIARTILEARIAEVREALRRARLMRHMAVVCGLGILVRGSFLVGAIYGHHVPRNVDRWSMLILIVLAAVAYFKGNRNVWSDRDIARLIEQKHPVLDSVLLTAIEYEPEADQPNGYLHERLIDHALARAATQNWPITVADKPYRQALMAACVAAIALLITEIGMRFNGPQRKGRDEIAKAAVTGSEATTFTATLTPGDTEVERGSRLVVEARFTGPVPADATLVISEPDGKERDRLPMRLTVDEQVFGGLIAKVDRDSKYHVEFSEQKSQMHAITVFDYPALVRSDVKVTPPEYTKLPAKETKNTQKVSAMEGSTIAWKIRVNKPLAEAEFFGADKEVIPLKPSATDPTVLEAEMPAEKTQKYRLHLVDDRERANKNPPWFTVTVLANQLAKIDVVFPKRDVQVSAIQELPVEAKVFDDLGVTQSGAVFNIGGNAKEILFKHAATAPQKKQDVRTDLKLEGENAQPRQLVSYYFWAEDKGPKGEVRRAMSDMFFADVRHYEDIFREAEAPPSEAGQPKGQTPELVDLQKQVVSATWRIVRDTNGGRTMEKAAPDVDVVHQSQGIAMEKVKEAMEKVKDGEIKAALTEAWKSMKDALEPLQQASADKKRAPLNQALTFEQTALEWLHRAMSREHEVARSKSMKPGQQANKNQIMDLELKQQEQRYEEEKAAAEEQTAEQQENLQVLNRLKELARRQEALAEKMKELQNQLAKAKTEEEKQELENQLQRLQAEQEQLLRDVDELKERMEKPENAQNMADAKEQLEQTREQVMDAAEQLKNKELTDAANAATRAQRELEKMQEDFRQKTSRKFADEMKQLRNQARAASERQKQISESLENQKAGEEGETGDSAKDLSKVLNNSQIGRQVEEQQEQVEKLLESMRQLSEQAEQSEPMLHRNLYDAVRKAQTSALTENLQETREQLRYGTQADAKEAERKAANSVEELQKGVEKAAESVLGSETEALRVAKSELDKLIKESQQQTAPGDQSKKGDPRTADANQQGQKPGDGQKPGKQGQQPGEGQKPGEKGQQASEQGDKGQGQGKGQPQDPKVAENGQQPGEGGQQPSPEGKEGEQPGEGKKDAKGKGQGQAAAGEPKGDQPGQEGEGRQPGQGGRQPSEQQQAGTQPGQQGQGEQPGQGQGQQPGEGGKEGSMPQQAGNQPGGQGQDQQPGEGEQPGQGGSAQGRGQAQQQAGTGSPDGRGGPDQPRTGNRTGRDNDETDRNDNQLMIGGTTGGRDSENDRHRPKIQGGDVPEALFFDDSKEQEDQGVFTGTGYERWSDRLRNVEELLNNPELRNEAAKIFDRAREVRLNMKRSNEAPQVAHLNSRITQPLIELRDRVVEELSKRDAGKNLAPVDRDPVPAEFRELVKRYYQELGRGN